MSTFDKVVMKAANHFVEMAEGNMREARKLYLEWVGECDPLISDDARPSWTCLIVAIDVMLPAAPPAA